MLRVLWAAAAMLVVGAGSGFADEPKPAQPEKAAQPHVLYLQLQPALEAARAAGVVVEQAKPIVIQARTQTEAVQKEVEELLKKLREKEGERHFSIRLPAQAPSPGTNQEVIALLKQVIQKLEGQGAQPGVRPHAVEWKKVESVRVKENPELDRARADVKAAEAHLAAARAHLAKLQGGAPGEVKGRLILQQPMPKLPGKWLEAPVRPAVPAPPAKASDLEQRLDRLIKEVDAIRAELKKGRK